MTVHEIKCWPVYFLELMEGRKTFELRKDDRGYQVGDILTIHEWDESSGYREGGIIRRQITSILRHGDLGAFASDAIGPGWVIMSLSRKIIL